jgi:hypothetical protein
MASLPVGLSFEWGLLVAFEKESLVGAGSVVVLLITVVVGGAVIDERFKGIDVREAELLDLREGGRAPSVAWRC